MPRVKKAITIQTPAPEIDYSKLLTLHQAADRLGVHHMTLGRAIAKKQLKARLGLGRGYRIDPADLDAYANSRIVGAE